MREDFAKREKKLFSEVAVISVMERVFIFKWPSPNDNMPHKCRKLSKLVPVIEAHELLSGLRVRRK
jgi:hypothetical protein